MMMTELEVRAWIAQLEKQMEVPTHATTFAEQAVIQADRRAIASTIETLRKVLGER